MKNKRGSHVDFAIAFVIFITFVIFLFAIIKPALSHKDSNLESFSDYLSREIINKTSGELTTILIVPVGILGDDDCFDLSSLTELENNFIAKNKEGTILKTTGKNVEANEFVKIYSTAETDIFTLSIYSFFCDAFSDYKTGLIKTEKIIFKSKLNELIVKDRNGLKEIYNINIPENINFNFSLITDEEGEVNKYNGELPSTGVFSNTYLINYMNETASTKTGLLKIMLW